MTYLRKILYVLYALLSAVVIWLAVVNHHGVMVYLTPLNTVFEVPLFLLGFALIAGTWLLLWLRGLSGQVRAYTTQRQLRLRVQALETEVAALRAQPGTQSSYGAGVPGLPGTSPSRVGQAPHTALPPAASEAARHEA